MSPPDLNAAQIDQYQNNGYLLISGCFAPDEIDLLHRTAKSDQELGAHAFGKSDGQGGGGLYGFRSGTILATTFMECLHGADALSMQQSSYWVTSPITTIRNW